MRGIKGNIKSIYNTQYSITLFEIFKTYSSIIMSRDFQKINIPKLPVLTTEEGIKRIKEFFGKLNDWKNISIGNRCFINAKKFLQKSLKNNSKFL